MSYDPFAQTFSKSRRNHPWPELDYIISDMRTQGYSRILDVGCGNGRFLEEARNHGFLPTQYLGIDSSSGMVEEAKKLHPEHQFLVCDMLHLEDFYQDISGNQQFDVILLLASFHHLETRAMRVQVLHDLRPFLSQRGRVYMTNWNLREQVRYEKSHRGNGDYAIKIGEFSRYYHGFSLEELEELFSETGWNILENRVFEGGRNIVSVIY